VLQNIERRRILEQPAGKDLAPDNVFLGRGPFIDENLNECAFFNGFFPRRRALTTGQFDNHVADPARFAGFQNQILSQIVAFVEQADGRNAILVGRDGTNFGGRCFASLIGSNAFCLGLRCIACFRNIGGLVRLAATDKQRCKNEGRCPLHRRLRNPGTRLRNRR